MHQHLLSLIGNLKGKLGAVHFLSLHQTNLPLRSSKMIFTFSLSFTSFDLSANKKEVFHKIPLVSRAYIKAFIEIEFLHFERNSVFTKNLRRGLTFSRLILLYSNNRNRFSIGTQIHSTHTYIKHLHVYINNRINLKHCMGVAFWPSMAWGNTETDCLG